LSPNLPYLSFLIYLLPNLTYFYRSLNPPVAETAMGKPLFKASEGGRIDILGEGDDITQSELQQGAGT